MCNTYGNYRSIYDAAAGLFPEIPKYMGHVLLLFKKIWVRCDPHLYYVSLDH